MKKLYEKSELTFALVFVGGYCVLMSIGDSLSLSVGVEKSVTLPISLLLSALLFIFIKRNKLNEKYGLCKPCIPARKVLFYAPMLILLSVNLWHGVSLNLSVTETVLYILTMLFVGFLEEVIFRGLLFSAMAKNGLKSAVIVSSITFGMGHIINLFNSSGAEIYENILQIIYACAAGFMLIMLFIRTKSLVWCIGFHGVFNALSAFSNEDILTSESRLLSCAFLSVISISYGLFLARKKKEGDMNDNQTCKRK